MYLEKLELQGFKSFATKTTLEFRKGITAIVGPNGSGKSNIADAIRWVLGEQSLKLIRGKKAEDVIFAGSDKKTKLGAAEVSLHLNNEDGKAPIDFSELVITRRVFRDGTGEYLVNKRPVRLLDIHMLLAKSNFGQRTYSVIGQGMVDSILMTSPQERKHFFDEAAGVRQYQLKREQTITKLEHTRDNLRQGEVLLQEIEPRLRSLTRQVRRLERRSEIERQLTDLQTSYYGRLLYDLRQQLAGNQVNLKALEKQRSERERQVTGLNTKLAALEQEQSRSEAFAGLQRQYERLQADKGVLLAEQAMLEGQRDAEFSRQGKTNVAWLEKQLTAVNQQLSDLERESSQLESSLGLLRSKTTALEAAENTARERQKTIEHSFREAQATFQRGAVTLPELKDEFKKFVIFEQAFLDELKSATTLESLQSLQKRGQELEHRTTRLFEQFERLGFGIDVSSLLQRQTELQAILQERDETIRQRSELTVAVGVQSEKQAMLGSNLERLRNERDRLERELARLRADTKENVSATIREQASALKNKIATVDEQLAAITKDIQQFNASETAKRDELFRLQRDLRAAQDQLNDATAKANEVRVEVARLETRVQDVEREIREEVKEEAWQAIFESTPAKPPPPEQADEILRVKHQLALIGGIDETVAQEYQQTDERYTFLKTQYDDLIKAAAQLEQGIAELDRTIKERFDEAFQKISAEFSSYFRILFRGGNAKLVLMKEVVLEETEELDEENEEDESTSSRSSQIPAYAGKGGQQGGGEKVITGIEIHATPPGKRVKGVTMLSGGERALTSIALICAIIANNPMPFAVLDEVDAALDEANSQRFAAILEKLAMKTQFVTITHNRATMEKSTILYGVTMGDDGVSKLLSVKLEEAEHVIKKYGNR